jgi:hypothetical protein
MTAKISAISDNIGSLGTNKGEAFRFGDDSSGQLAGFRNKIINGGIQIWQRGSGSSANDTYPADRWLLRFTVGTVGAALGGSILANENNSLNIVATGTTNASLAQKIENAGVLNGKKVTVSFLLDVYSGSPTFTFPLIQNFGTGGSPSADVVTFPATDVTVGKKRILTYNLPLTAGKTFGTNNNSNLEFRMSMNGTFSIGVSEFQLEEGSIATPFEQRPIGLELSLCQRYYQGVSSVFTASSTNAIGLGFPVTMRAVPIVTTMVGSGITYYDIEAKGFRFLGNALAVDFRWTASAEL